MKVKANINLDYLARQSIYFIGGKKENVILLLGLSLCSTVWGVFRTLSNIYLSFLLRCPLNILAKSSISDVWQYSEYAKLHIMLRWVWFYLVSKRRRFPYGNVFLKKITWKHIFEQSQKGKTSKKTFFFIKKKLARVKWETRKKTKGCSFIFEWRNGQKISKRDNNLN